MQTPVYRNTLGVVKSEDLRKCFLLTLLLIFVAGALVTFTTAGLFGVSLASGKPGGSYGLGILLALIILPTKGSFGGALRNGYFGFLLGTLGWAVGTLLLYWLFGYPPRS